MFGIFLRHTVLAGVTVGSLLLFGDNPRVLVFTLLLLLPIRLFTVRFLIRAQAGGRPAGLAAQIERFSTPPRPGATPLAWRDEKSGEPVEFGGYLMMSGVYALFAFLLVHVGSDRELHIEAATFARELTFAAVLAAMYGVEEFWAGAVIFRPDAAPWENYAFNVGGRMILLHLSILICGGLLAFFQSQDMEPNAWLFFGPVLALKHLSDMAGEISAQRRG